MTVTTTITTKGMSSLGPNFTARPTVRIDLGAVKSNYRALQKLVGQVKIGASVKADAYGLGADRVGKALYGAGCRNFFVATAGEGKLLRDAIGENASIYVLNGPAPRDLTLFFGSNLKPVINSLVQATIWAKAISDVKRPPFSVIHLDTGINRLGFGADEQEKLKQNKGLIKALNVDMVMSHLACAPDKDHPLNEKQLKAFKSRAARLPVMPMSLANSAGIYLGRPYHFNMVRPGISLYGGNATLAPENEVTKPVISLMAPVLQIKTVKKGDSLGYNATFVAKKDLKVAIVGAGYADGIPINTSSTTETHGGYATLQKKRVPIVGRVSMDLTILDVSSLKKTPRIGDWAEFHGEFLEEDALTANTITYELLVRVGQRCRRLYV